MSPQFQSILDAALKLPESERGELAAMLLDSFEDEDLEEISEAEWAAELHQRIEDVRSGKSVTVPWEEVRKELEEIAKSGDQSCPRPFPE